MDWCSIVDGVLAQLGEHLPYTQRVVGSKPIPPTIGQQEWSCSSIRLERRPVTPEVAGSSPVSSATLNIFATEMAG